jgi:hypothetical protein
MLRYRKSPAMLLVVPETQHESLPSITRLKSPLALPALLVLLVPLPSPWAPARCDGTPRCSHSSPSLSPPALHLSSSSISRSTTASKASISS